MTRQQPRPLEYWMARPLIETGDILLYRPGPMRLSRPLSWRGPLIRLVARYGGTRENLASWQRYSHAGMAVWSYDVLLLVDMVFAGGRAIRLSREVAAYPGCYDVYRLPGLTDDHRWKMARKMLRLTGACYGSCALARAALSHVFVMPRRRDDQLNGSAPHCAQAVSAACRAGGRDPIEFLADRYTTPNHLALPNFAKPMWRLVP